MQRDIPFNPKKLSMRPKNKISFSQFVAFKRDLSAFLTDVRKPPEFFSEKYEQSHYSVSLIMNSSHVGTAVVCVVKHNAPAPTIEAMQMCVNGEKPPKTVAHTVVPTTKDDDLVVEVLDLHHAFKYDVYSYAQHPNGDPVPNTSLSLPSGSSSETILASLITFTTDKAPEPDIIVPWEEMDPEEQTTELLAVIKDKKVKNFAKERMIVVPISKDATAQDNLARERWITFQDWWAFEKDARRAFCIREMTFAAKNKEIRKDADADGCLVMDDDWLSLNPDESYDKTKHQFRDVENAERWVRWRSFCLWYRGYDGDDAPESSSEEESEYETDEEEEEEAVVEEPAGLAGMAGMFGGSKSPIREEMKVEEETTQSPPPAGLAGMAGMFGGSKSSPIAAPKSPELVVAAPELIAPPPPEVKVEVEEVEEEEEEEEEEEPEPEWKPHLDDEEEEVAEEKKEEPIAVVEEVKKKEEPVAVVEAAPPKKLLGMFGGSPMKAAAAPEEREEKDDEESEASAAKDGATFGGQMAAAKLGKSLSEKLKKKKSKKNMDKLKKTVKTNARLKFLGGKSSAIDKAVAKVEEMVNVTDDFEAREAGLKPKLKGMALLKAKTKALMMSRKLAQLTGSLKNVAAGKKASAEDMADCDLFEEVDMAKFEPEPVDERPPTPPPPPVPFFTSWPSMKEDEKLAELKLACMDSDVLIAAITAGVQIPEIEDCKATFKARNEGWVKFRAWYSDNEEAVEGAAAAGSKKDLKAAPVKKGKEPPKIAEARKIFSRNEAAAARKDAEVAKDYKGEGDIDFRNWYNKSTTGVRGPFLLRTAKLLETTRRVSVVLREYCLPTPPVFQFVGMPVREGPPPMEKRVRLFGSRYPETFTWDEVEQWYEPEELAEEEAILAEAEREATVERRRLQMIASEQEREQLETEMCMWEDHRSYLMRVGMNEMNKSFDPFAGCDTLQTDYAFFGGLPKEKKKYEEWVEKKFKQGTGLLNEDEFSDDKERQKAEAEARGRRREEEAKKKELDAKRQAELDKKKAIEEERTNRMRKTADERKRIIQELADLKENRRLEKERKLREEEEKVERARREEEEKRRRREEEEEERRKREQAVLDAERWKARREAEMERDREEGERELMEVEDGEGRVQRERYGEMMMRKQARKELLEYAYLQPGGGGGAQPGEANLLWAGPVTYKSKTRRRHVDGYSIPDADFILEFPESEGAVKVDKGVSSKFYGMLGLPGNMSESMVRGARGGEGGRGP